MAFEYNPRQEDGSLGGPVKAGNDETAEEKAARLEQENKLLKLQNQANTERMEFMEDLIAEIAMQVYK
ncbi:hypothetical protein ACOMCU_24900 [Lysinibacillus sp. UGB7]|uniref:hypothetical protein n=1 Tax=Lysinibacillus sp. UGB7 TaxID=3411039 RepID=UPI003B76C2D6